MNFLKQTFSFFLWNLATGTTILIVSIVWLAVWQDVWSPAMLGNRILAISLIIASICEGLRLKKGSNEPFIYLIFPITIIIFGLAGWLLRYPILALLDFTLLLVIYLFFIFFLLSTHHKDRIYSRIIKIPALDPIIDAEVRRVAAQFTT